MWNLRVTKRAEKSLGELDHQHKLKIVRYLDELIKLKDPHTKGKALTGQLSGLWRFRVTDYRIICQIDGEIITVLVLDIGHRRDIYNE